jgi:hypothetical protein
VPEHCAHAATPELRGAVLELEAGGRVASATAASASELRRWLEARELGLTPPAAPGPDPSDPSTAPPKELLPR